MTPREHFLNIMNRKSTKSGFWHGDPNPASIDNLYARFDVKSDFDLGLKLGSHCRWVHPESHGAYRDDLGRALFNPLYEGERVSLGQAGPFAECEDPSEVDKYDWPKLEYLCLDKTCEEIERTAAAGQAVLSGMWSCFFHVVADFFGMENYFIKMYTDPAVVDAVTEHVVDFYMRANEVLFDRVGDKIDMFFFGNDFGSQLDTLVSPEMFDRFIMPSFTRFTEQAHRHGMKVLLHSCGSIYRVIPKLIDAGVDALHPIQAQAVNMSAEKLSREFNGKIVFVGGVDTQQLLPNATPQQVRDEVHRLRDLFGPNYIVSPSHESILPDVPWENVQAMAEAAAD